MVGKFSRAAYYCGRSQPSCLKSYNAVAWRMARMPSTPAISSPWTKVLEKLFEDAAKRRFDLVLFWSLDRFTREGVLETLNHLQRLSAYGVGWRSYQENYLDSCGPFRDVVISLMATLAKQERLRISERTKAGLQRARERGKYSEG